MAVAARSKTPHPALLRYAVTEWRRRQSGRAAPVGHWTPSLYTEQGYSSDFVLNDEEFQFCCAGLQDCGGTLLAHAKTMYHVGQLFGIGVAEMQAAVHGKARQPIPITSYLGKTPPRMRERKGHRRRA